MESDSYPDSSADNSYAHKIAAKELVKYCLEFDRWRTAGGCIVRRAPDPRRRGMLIPHLPGRQTPPEGQPRH